MPIIPQSSFFVNFANNLSLYIKNKRNEKKVKLYIEKYRNILNNISDIFFECDENLNILFLSNLRLKNWDIVAQTVKAANKNNKAFIYNRYIDKITIGIILIGMAVVHILTL